MIDQFQYVRILFADLGFSLLQQRDFLALRFGGRRYLDDLTSAERSMLIDDLKDRKCGAVAEPDDQDLDADRTARERWKMRGDR